jgi:hypothetical protein
MRGPCARAAAMLASPTTAVRAERQSLGREENSAMVRPTLRQLRTRAASTSAGDQPGRSRARVFARRASALRSRGPTSGPMRAPTAEQASIGSARRA